jgi:hypothetical protein
MVYVNGYLRLLSHFFEDVKNTKTYKNWDSISDEANSEDGALVWEDLEVDLIAEDDDYVERSVPSTAIVSTTPKLQLHYLQNHMGAMQLVVVPFLQHVEMSVHLPGSQNYNCHC